MYGPMLTWVDVEHRQFGDADVVQDFSTLLGDLLAGFGPDLTRLHVDEVLAMYWLTRSSSVALRNLTPFS